jgi:hypothetical protein
MLEVAKGNLACREFHGNVKKALAVLETPG